jgi:hypothetical protein
MAVFLEKYVRQPMDSLVAAERPDLPDLLARMDEETISITIGGETIVIPRLPAEESPDEHDEIPADADDFIAGP